MADKKITLKVLTHEGLALSDEATSVVAPGWLGYLGILYNHAPLLSIVQPGTLSWHRMDGQKRSAQVGSGLLEVSHNTVTLLVDRVDASAELSPVHH